MTTTGAERLDGGAARAFLGAGWEALWAGSPAATTFQSAGWYRAWLAAVAPHEGAEPLVLRVPHAAVALQRCAGADGAPQLAPLSWPWADYHDAVAAGPADEAAAALGPALEALVQETGLPLLLDDVVPGGVLDRATRGDAFHRAPASPTGAIDLGDAAHVRAILSRPEHLLKRRRLERRGAVDCRHHTGRDEILHRMPDFIALHTRQWEGRADAVAPFGDGVVDGAFTAMVEELAPAGGVVLSELLLDGRPVAMYFGFRHRDWFGGYRTCYDPELFRLSPGHLLLHQMIADFAARGVRTLDLMRGSYAYKREYVPSFRHNLRISLAVPGASRQAA
ncbi:MAG TPA: GNAT family N-acetyltransferase [Longimicrobium sp.]|nr:GNAT family N-acetyltransferase [Longimicrobium sp.]